MWQVQIDHPVQRPITFQMRDGVNDFLRAAHATDPTMPADVRALEEAVGVRLVVADRTDPDEVGFVQWRVAFYVAGDINNFLLLLDDFFVYKAKAIAREQPFQVQIFPHTGVRVTVVDDVMYEHVQINEQTATPPLGIFEAQPCIGKRIVVLNIQIENENTISVVITGNTWAFRSRLDTFGVSGGYQSGTDESERRTYFRVLRSLDVSDDAQQDRVKQLVGEAVFKNLAMRVKLDKKPDEDSPVEAFIDELKDIPCLHFATTFEEAVEKK